MTTKHLPGPWMILGTPVSPIPPEMFPVLIGVEDAEGGVPIMAVHNVNGDYGDARLVAAAPDLLEALQEMVAGDAEAIEDAKRLGVPFPDEMLAAYHKARAAIARATGELP